MPYLAKVSSMHLFIHLSIYFFIYSFIYLLIYYLLIHSFIHNRFFFTPLPVACLAFHAHLVLALTRQKKRRKIYSYSLLIKNTYYIFIGPSLHYIFFLNGLQNQRNFAKYEQWSYLTVNEAQFLTMEHVQKRLPYFFRLKPNKRGA